MPYFYFNKYYYLFIYILSFSTQSNWLFSLECKWEQVFLDLSAVF